MKLLLIDDHASFCEGLKAALESLRPDYQVDFQSDASFVPAALLQRKGYDLFLIDLMMPGLGGIGLLHYLNTHRQNTPVMVLSSVQDPEIIRRVMAMGALGYLSKAYSVQQIVNAIEECRAGQLHVPQSVNSGGVRLITPEQDTPLSATNLTRRQVEILGLMEQGLDNQAIADTLFIGKATVKTHINQLFRLFGVKNRINCLRAARASGVVPPV